MAFPPDQFIWLPDNRWDPRENYPINLIILHSTRGGTNSQMEVQDEATINWFRSPNSLAPDGSWGAAASAVIGHEGKLTWFMSDDKYPTWSAGWTDVYGISFELAQPTMSTPFTLATIQRLAIEVARLCKKYSIPVERTSYLVNADAGKVKGIIGHEDTPQGKSAGKSDPGPQFPWDSFLARVRNIMTLEVKDDREEIRGDQIWWVQNLEGGLRGWNGLPIPGGWYSILLVAPGIRTRLQQYIDVLEAKVRKFEEEIAHKDAALADHITRFNTIRVALP